MKPLISVIIPVFNTGESALKLLECLKSQTYKNFEIIVVDDGSTAKKGIRKLKSDALVHYYYQENHGASSARNLGLKYARGDFISFLDSDDLISHNFFSELLAPFSADVDLTVCGFHYNRLNQNSSSDVFIKPLPPKKTHETSSHYHLRLFVSDGRLYSSVNKLYRAKIIKSHHLHFDEKLNFAEDTKFVVDYLSCAKGKIVAIQKPLYIYNFGTDTSTVNYSSLNWQNWQQSYAYFQQKFPGHSILLKRLHLRWRGSQLLSVARSSIPRSEKLKYLSRPSLFFAEMIVKFRK
ncbi:MAG: glycosyltransferase family 2 protein [Candidatus Saccharibacteria bacterium]|nr:glycosyltransferase family 2 protein [Candidatus Saccharibacteria bacterium]